MGNNREWIKKTLSHIQTEKVPYNFFFTPAALEKAQEHYGSPVDDVLNFPIRVNAVSSLKPVYAHPSDSGRNVREEFGVMW